MLLNIEEMDKRERCRHCRGLSDNDVKTHYSHAVHALRWRPYLELGVNFLDLRKGSGRHAVHCRGRISAMVAGT